VVDTGLAFRDHNQPTVRMRVFLTLNRVPRDLEETAIRQTTGLGYSSEDDRHIVLTRLHLDYGGGLPDFLWARVQLFAAGYQAATPQRHKGLLNWLGYDVAHWHGSFPQSMYQLRLRLL